MSSEEQKSAAEEVPEEATPKPTPAAAAAAAEKVEESPIRLPEPRVTRAGFQILTFLVVFNILFWYWKTSWWKLFLLTVSSVLPMLFGPAKEDPGCSLLTIMDSE